MKYVLLGSISPSWLGKQAERLKKSNEKLKQLGIKQHSVLYTQGQYDFVETIEAPGPESEKKQQIYIRLIETASIPLGPFRWEAGISGIF